MLDGIRNYFGNVRKPTQPSRTLFADVIILYLKKKSVDIAYVSEITDNCYLIWRVLHVTFSASRQESLRVLEASSKRFIAIARILFVEVQSSN
jgi:hypothetical protein